VAFIIFLTIIVFIGFMEAAIPFLVKRTIAFGVSIPERHLKDAKMVSYKKRYALTVIIFSLVSLLVYYLWADTSQPKEEQLVLVGTAIQFAIILLSTALYFYYHAKTLQYKKKQGWGENNKSVKITDLSVRSLDEMLGWPVYLIPIFITVGVIAYTASMYHVLPEQIPTHWGPNGKPDAFTTKTPFSAITLPLILLVMQGMFLGINEMTRKSGIKLSASSTEASRIRQLTLRKYTSWFMFLTSLLLTMLFSFLQFTTIHEGLVGNAVMFAVPIIFFLLVLIGSIVFAVKVGNAGNDISSYSEGAIAEYDEDHYWKGGLFYFNKNDPSIFVEKRFGVGWTINFANPKGYFMIFGPLILIILFSYLGN
jgi:uncharacterized membrane protein